MISITVHHNNQQQEQIQHLNQNKNLETHNLSGKNQTGSGITGELELSSRRITKRRMTRHWKSDSLPSPKLPKDCVEVKVNGRSHFVWPPPPSTIAAKSPIDLKIQQLRSPREDLIYNNNNNKLQQPPLRDLNGNYCESNEELKQQHHHHHHQEQREPIELSKPPSPRPRKSSVINVEEEKEKIDRNNTKTDSKEDFGRLNSTKVSSLSSTQRPIHGLHSRSVSLIVSPEFSSDSDSEWLAVGRRRTLPRLLRRTRLLPVDNTKAAQCGEDQIEQEFRGPEVKPAIKVASNEAEQQQQQSVTVKNENKAEAEMELAAGLDTAKLNPEAEVSQWRQTGKWLREISDEFAKSRRWTI